MSDLWPLASILATDLDEESLDCARKGLYSKERLKYVLPPLGSRYFLAVDDNQYQVSPKIKGSVSFCQFDLVHGESSEKFDLIVCRNVLIYFSKELQEKVLLKFYQALNPSGFLWLGKAESLWGKPQKLFECVDKGAKIFKKVFAF
jgi:chemotaxis protein methyltransferase CheR